MVEGATAGERGASCGAAAGPVPALRRRSKVTPTPRRACLAATESGPAARQNNPLCSLQAAPVRPEAAAGRGGPGQLSGAAVQGNEGGCGPHLVDGAELADVLPPADLHPVHQQELDRQQAAQVDVGEGRRQVLRQRGLGVPVHVGVEDLLAQHARGAQHGPTGVHQLGLPVPAGGATRRGARGGDAGWVLAWCVARSRHVALRTAA
jgi:hypothetical protein